MTEQEWNASMDVQTMLTYARATLGVPGAPSWERMSDRKLRLFAAACARSVWPLLVDSRSRRAVETAERFADGEATEGELANAWEEQRRLNGTWIANWASEINIENAVQQMIARNSMIDRDDAWPTDEVFAAILRSIVPFAPMSLPEAKCQRCVGKGHLRQRGSLLPACPDCESTGSVAGDCPWLTSTVRDLAIAAYQNTGRKCPYCQGGPPDLCDRCDHGWVGAGQLDPDRLNILADCLEEADCADSRFLMPLRGFRPCRECETVKHSDHGKRHGLEGCRDCSHCEGSGWVLDPTPRYRGFASLDVLLGLA